MNEVSLKQILCTPGGTILGLDDLGKLWRYDHDKGEWYRISMKKHQCEKCASKNKECGDIFYS